MQVLTNAIHDLDMLQYWLGDIAEVFAMEGPKERPFEVDSTVQLSFKFSCGAVGSFLLSECVFLVRSMIWTDPTSARVHLICRGKPGQEITLSFRRPAVTF